MKSKSRKSSTSSPTSRRKLYIFTGLLGALVGTSAFLLAMAPAPLKPDNTAPSLASYSQSPANPDADLSALPDLQGISDTRVLIQPNAWRYIYIHHSRTPPGPASQLGDNPADHFIITSPSPGSTALSNDDGRVEMTLRWSHQVPALPPAGVKSINPQCISIALVGDLDRNVPTPAQFQKTLQLVRTLQKQLGIPASNVLLRDDRNSPSGTGHMFPTEAFREHLLH